MEIIIKGTKKEVETAKDVMQYSCVFNREYCEIGSNCKECEKKHNLKFTCITEDEESEGK